MVRALKSGMGPLNWFDDSAKIFNSVKALKVDGMPPPRPRPLM